MKLRGFTYETNARGQPERWHHTHVACTGWAGDPGDWRVAVGVTGGHLTRGMLGKPLSFIHHVNIPASPRWHPDSPVRPAELCRDLHSGAHPLQALTVAPLPLSPFTKALSYPENLKASSLRNKDDSCPFNLCWGFWSTPYTRLIQSSRVNCAESEFMVSSARWAVCKCLLIESVGKA